VAIDVKSNYYILPSDSYVLIYDGSWNTTFFSPANWFCLGDLHLAFNAFDHLQVHTYNGFTCYDGSEWTVKYYFEERLVLDALGLSGKYFNHNQCTYIDDYENTYVTVAPWDTEKDKSLGLLFCQWIPDSKLLENISIVGPVEVNELSCITYTTSGYYNDYSSADITSTVTWTMDPNLYATIDGNVLTTKDVQVQQQIIIRANCRIDGYPIVDDANGVLLGMTEMFISDEKEVRIRPTHLKADLNADGKVDLNDFAAMAGDWLAVD